jgi:hypothetical protein
MLRAFDFILGTLIANVYHYSFFCEKRSIIDYSQIKRGRPEIYPRASWNPVLCGASFNPEFVNSRTHTQLFSVVILPTMYIHNSHQFSLQMIPPNQGGSNSLPTLERETIYWC